MVACLAMTAMADPPVNKYQSRWYGNSVYAGACNDVENGYFCRDLSASENYDVKGTFQYVDATINSWRYQYDPSDGSYVSGSRMLSCPIDPKAISVNPNRVTLEATLDPGAPGCYSSGYLVSYDPVNGYQTVEWLYTVPMAVSGEWADPFNYSNSVVNQKGTYFDGWSGTTSSYGQHCNQTWGDSMRSGGFTINTRSWEFLGPVGPAWSSYYLSNCNDRNKQH